MMDAQPQTAESASRGRLLRASAGLLGLLVLAGLAVIGLFSLPVGAAIKAVALGWLLVVLAGYWLYAGLGYRSLLLLQLLAFSGAASLGSLNLVLGLPVLRSAALGLAGLGGVLALANLLGMLRAAHQRHSVRRAA